MYEQAKKAHKEFGADAAHLRSLRVIPYDRILAVDGEPEGEEHPAPILVVDYLNESPFSKREWLYASRNFIGERMLNSLEMDKRVTRFPPTLTSKMTER